MVQRLVGIGRAGDRIKQNRKDLRELAAFMRVAGHGLKIPVGLLDVGDAVGRQNRPDLFRVAFRRQEERCRIRLVRRRIPGRLSVPRVGF